MTDGGDKTSRPRTQGLRNIRQPNLQNRVYELLLNMIIDGKYRDNEMLPSERVLCEELGVSRTVIRESMKSLQARGVLTAIHGKGIRVAPAVGSDISEAFMLYQRRQHRDVPFEDLTDVRFALETRIATRAAQRASDAEIAELKGILDRMPESTSSLEMYVQVDMDFHLKLAHLSHNMLFVTIVESLLFPLQRSFKKSFEGHDSALLHREHLGIYTCVESHDADGARDAMRAHLEHATRSLYTEAGAG
jgi:GntR family transcriptional regulator, sialic acid-inducible nan operon repressor